jgi:CheY-like chemotaxis protein/HPt (histidine-containing phosphotransfer) domain-containing protein
MKDLLDSFGYRFELAANGKCALEALQASEYSLVLMDCQMPVLDGYEATRSWRRLESEQQRARVPIIAVTAHALIEERDKVLRAGMDDLLTKPVQVSRLREMLEKWLQGAKRFSVPPSKSRASESGNNGAALAARAKGAQDSEAQSSGRLLLDPATPRSARMYELFVEHAQDDLEFIQEAAAIEDMEALRLRAHRLKGSAYTFGAEQLGDKAAELERLAKAGERDGARTIADLITIYSRTEKALNGQLAKAGEIPA